MLCAALVPFPVVGVLHVEAAAIVAGVGCALAAWTTHRAAAAGLSLRRLVATQCAALGVPVVWLTASLVLRPNCAYPAGLGLYLLLVPPSIALGTGLGWLWPARWPSGGTTGVLVLVALGGVIWDLGFHPQLFTYSHVFGGVLGPIYDVELAIRPGLFAAKGATLLWATLLLLAGSWRRGMIGAGPVGLAAGLAALTGLASPALGITQTSARIEAALSDRVDLGAAVLHVHPDMPTGQRRQIADEVLYRLDTITAALDEHPRAPIQVYLYPDPDTKAALLGSRETSVVPVWLRTPQVHMLAEQVPGSLGHELVHVVGREFGMAGLRASPAVGLVEGLAVALEPPLGLPDPADVVRAGLSLPDSLGGIRDPGAIVRRTMSAAGFWTARAGIAYQVNGAFVAWLLERYGSAPLKRAYRSGRFDTAYGVPLDELSRQWGASVRRRPLDAEALAVARWQFGRPSLFELRCPHHVPPAVRASREGWDAWDHGRLDRAEAAFGRAVAADPLLLPALAGRVRVRLARGGGVTQNDLRRAQARVDSLPDPAAWQHLGDVRRLAGGDGRAAYQAAADSLAPVAVLDRYWIQQRIGLPRPVLRNWLGTPDTTVTTVLARHAPRWAARRDAAAFRATASWARLRALCPTDPAERWIWARAAYDAGDGEAAARLLDGLDDAFRAQGRRSFVPVVRDLRQRARWRRTAALPAILALPRSPPHASAPPCLVSRPAPGDGVRAARGRTGG